MSVASAHDPVPGGTPPSPTGSGAGAPRPGGHYRVVVVAVTRVGLLVAAAVVAVAAFAG